MKKSRTLFRITRFVLLKLPYVTRFLAKARKPASRMLIIKTDAIGDYVLFRNFLRVVYQSPKFKHYRITLLGNELWKDLVLKHDCGFVHDVLFTRAEDLYFSPLKTLRLGWRLFRNNYSIVLQPSSTRLLITDGLAALTGATQIIGFDGDCEGILRRYKIKTDRFYTQKLSLPGHINFEFERSKFFFETILDHGIIINGPSIPFDKTEGNYIVVFPGAGNLKRQWSAENFLRLINRISSQSELVVYLAGSSNEIATGDFLMQNLPANGVVNLIAKTSLPELVNLIGNAALVIANETSAIHIAAATQTRTVCISGGGHFGRFVPYPNYIKSAPLCVYQKMDCYCCNWICKYNIGQVEAFPCIASVTLEAVWSAVSAILPADNL